MIIASSNMILNQLLNSSFVVRNVELIQFIEKNFFLVLFKRAADQGETAEKFQRLENELKELKKQHEKIK